MMANPRTGVTGQSFTLEVYGTMSSGITAKISNVSLWRNFTVLFVVWHDILNR